MKELKIIIISIAITLIIAIISFIIFSGDKNPKTNIPMPWNSFVINNQVNILGLALGKSTIKNVMQILGNDAELALFKNKKDNTKQLEVYFNSAKIGGLNVKVIAELETNNNILEFLNENIKDYESLPSGNEKVIFTNFANNNLLDLIIKNLTIVPKTNLTKDIILQRFGKPEITNQEFWQYPKKGLKIIMDDKLKILEYSPKYIN